MFDVFQKKTTNQHKLEIKSAERELSVSKKAAAYDIQTRKFVCLREKKKSSTRDEKKNFMFN